MSSPVTGPALTIVRARERVWRVGFRPEPWAWSGWEWAGPNGRFGGRWDDHRGNFRTVYAGSTLLACLLEVLAGFRRDLTVSDALDAITEDDSDRTHFPTAPAGEVPYSWLEARSAASASLSGRFCAVTTSESIAALRPHFVALAHRLGLHDFDTAALKDGRPRTLTQAVATYLHATTDLDGVRFASRHGDELTLWAIFERAGDGAVSPTLTDTNLENLTPEHPDLVEAFQRLGLRWAAA